MKLHYEIKQLPIENENVFMGLSFVGQVKLSDYETTYSGNIETNESNVYNILEEIYRELNINHPSDYKTRSLSTSDIVVLNGKYYFCDRIGFKEIK